MTVEIHNYCTRCGEELDEQDRERIRSMDGPDVCALCVVSAFNDVVRPIAKSYMEMIDALTDAFEEILNPQESDDDER